MKDYVIITDSCCDLSAETADKEELTVIPLLLNLEGNVTEMNGETYIHLHAVFGDHDARAFGGHLKSAVIGATCEMFIEPVENVIDRVKDDKTGLNIFDI